MVLWNSSFHGSKEVVGRKDIGDFYLHAAYFFWSLIREIFLIFQYHKKIWCCLSNWFVFVDTMNPAVSSVSLSWLWCFGILPSFHQLCRPCLDTVLHIFCHAFPHADHLAFSNFSILILSQFLHLFSPPIYT